MFKKKKKRGCLGRIIRLAFFVTVLFFGYFFLEAFLEDDKYEYINENEVAQSKEDFTPDDLMTAFFEYYGFYPDSSSSNDYYFTDYMGDDDYSDYYDNWSDSDYYNNNQNQYDYDYDDSSYDKNTYNDWNNYDWNNNDWGSNQQTASTPANTNSSSNKPSSASTSLLSKFVACAKNYLGTPYVWGGTSKSGIDCSGLVYLAAKDAGLGTLPRTAATLHGIASRINKSDMVEGDLVFFASSGSISHVAIYAGNNKIIHAISEGSQTGVVTSDLNAKYWKNHYYSSGRIMTDSASAQRAKAASRSRSMSQNR